VSARLRTRTRTTDLHDLIEDDAQVVATEGFQPHAMSVPVERGRYYRLNDPIVRQFPQYFAVVIPVGQLLGEIER